jgi:hypothetical protein
VLGDNDQTHTTSAIILSTTYNKQLSYVPAFVFCPISSQFATASSAKVYISHSECCGSWCSALRVLTLILRKWLIMRESREDPGAFLRRAINRRNIHRSRADRQRASVPSARSQAPLGRAQKEQNFMMRCSKISDIDLRSLSGASAGRALMPAWQKMH